jgi:hypothetical protein
MKRFFLIVLVVAVSGLFTIARGQTPVAPEKAQSIRRLLELTGTHALVQQLIEEMMSSLRSNVPSDQPETRDKIIRIYEDEMKKSFTVEKMNEFVIPIYDKYFTGDELTALVEFYESPLGKKVVSVLPQIFSESSAAGEKLGLEVQERASERIRNEVLPTIKPTAKSRPAAKKRSTRRP